MKYTTNTIVLTDFGLSAFHANMSRYLQCLAIISTDVKTLYSKAAHYLPRQQNIPRFFAEIIYCSLKCFGLKRGREFFPQLID